MDIQIYNFHKKKVSRKYYNMRILFGGISIRGKDHIKSKLNKRPYTVFNENYFATSMTFAKPLKAPFSATDSRPGIVVVVNCV